MVHLTAARFIAASQATLLHGRGADFCPENLTCVQADIKAEFPRSGTYGDELVRLTEKAVSPIVQGHPLFARAALRGDLIWIDLEMTGLDPQKSVILEIAAVVTDASLRAVAEGPDLAIHYPEKALENMEAWSKKQHQSSGLLERVRASSVDCRKAEKDVLGFLSKHCKKGKSPLCGNSIWQDRRFLIKYMPELEAFFHYRNVDVSSIKELAKRWYPSLPVYKKKKAHLALSDIQESINELKYYREKVFLP